MTRTFRHNARWMRGIAPALIAVVGLGCESWPGPEDTPAEPRPAAATVDGQTIALADVDERIRRDLFEEAFGKDASRLYTARRETVGELIDEQLLAAKAAATGQTSEAWLEDAVRALPPISDAEITQLFEENRERLPASATIEAYEDQLRAYLGLGRIQQVLAGLREEAAISISLPRQRTRVAATGPSLGPEGAPITIVEFSDFQCPFCARVVPTVKALHERYPDEVRIVYRHLPLEFHAQAKPAAIASVCADAQGSFWAYHDRLFENPKALERDDLIAHANEVGLDAGAFTTCLDDPASAEVVEVDARAAAEVGATGTPTFFVNGVKLTGAQPVERFAALIDDELRRMASAANTPDAPEAAP